MRFSRRPIPKEETPQSSIQHRPISVPQSSNLQPNIHMMSPQGILQLQRTLGNRAVRNLLQRQSVDDSHQQPSANVVQLARTKYTGKKRPYQLRKPLRRAYIYEIVATSPFYDRHFSKKVRKGDVVYRGKTIQPLRSRYNGHLNDSKHTEWRGVTKIKLLEDGSGVWTPLELAANEQWYIEKQGFDYLGNRIQGVRRRTFRKYRKKGVFSYSRANLPKGWEPSQ